MMTSEHQPVQPDATDGSDGAGRADDVASENGRAGSIPPNGKNGMSGGPMSERMRVLELLEQGKITASEAADLLAALSEQSPPDERRERSRGRGRGRWGSEERWAERPRWFRVRVTDARSGRTRTNFTIPIGMVGFGVGFAQKFKVKGVDQLDDILDAVRSGQRGTVFDVSGEGGERVEIIIE